jgi:glucose-6-phosphate dehydrogenase assembly protein OpcA
MDDVWSERDTTPSAVEAALRQVLTARHRLSDSYAPARVLNVVVIADAQFRGEVINRLLRVGRYHPSRLILCSVTPGRQKMDAVVRLTSDVDDPKPGVLAVLRERVELEIGDHHLRHLDTIVGPLLVSDIVTLAWAPHGHVEGVNQLRRLAAIVLLDSQDEPDVRDALARALALAENAYVVDLAWLRSTPWRERVAAAFDPPALRRSLMAIEEVVVRHRHDSAASGLLFCGWLASRLGWRPEGMMHRGEDLIGHARGRRGDVSLVCRPIDMDAPGLCGVTITTAAGDTVTLDRAPGGLKAVRRLKDGTEQQWRMLGASRGEGGILGEGVRQALLRDPTYLPALSAARAMAA